MRFYYHKHQRKYVLIHQIHCYARLLAKNPCAKQRMVLKRERNVSNVLMSTMNQLLCALLLRNH